MRILFIHISQNWQGRVYPEYPLGLGLIATLTKQAGHEVHLHDMAVDDAPIEEVVGRWRPDVAALSFLSTSATMAADTVTRLKRGDCGHIISGGIHTSIFPDHAIRMGIDIAVVGEGEPVILPLLAALSAIGRGCPIPPLALTGIPSVVYRNALGEIESNEAASANVDVDALPPVDRSIYDLRRYPHHSIITSRGCPFQCKFCCAWGPGGRRGRMASPRRILDELEMLADRYGPMTVYWADDMFFFNQAKRIEFCRLMKERQLPIRWIAQLRADNLTPALVEALKDAGCEKVCLGAESGSDALLKSVDKRLTRADIAAGIRCAVEGGLRVKTWWILGLPGGSYEDQLASLELIEEVRPHEVAVHTFVPLPGTVYWDRAEEYGIRLPPIDRLETLYYYGRPKDLLLDYLTPEQMEDIIGIYDRSLTELGYVPTDKARADTPYVYTSPSLKKTFEV